MISVVIPTYNRQNVLPRAVASVLKQKDVFFELIVVDDGSTDDTASLLGPRTTHHVSNNRLPAVRCSSSVALESWPVIRVFRQEENKGPAAARNVGIKQARGAWIAFLDSATANTRSSNWPGAMRMVTGSGTGVNPAGTTLSGKSDIGEIRDTMTISGAA